MSSVAHTRTLNPLADHTVSARLAKKRTRHVRERLIEGLLFLCASLSGVVTVGIVLILVTESYQFFQHVSLFDFLTDRQWTPLFDDAHYGIMVLLSGTVVSTFVGLAVAMPLGTMMAIYLSEFAPLAVREIAKPFLELLGGVPTIVYGYFALLYVTPALQFFFPGLPGFNLLSAGLVMGIMIIPYISSVSEDAMRSVPMAMREGSYAMGATRFQTAVRVVTPAAFSGIAAAYILGISRAVGETMIVAVAAGMQPNLTWNPAEPAATITAYIVQVALGDLPHGSIGYQTIFAAGATAIPVGVAGAVYLEEYAPKNWMTDIIEINVTNLAGVPSIIYGLLALGLFVYKFGFGQSILSAGLTLALLILPVVIVATREAIRSIPQSIREGSYALGATQWQTVRYHILPYSSAGILTGIIIGMARAIGETAPIITIGALTFIAFLPPAPLKAEPPFVSFEWLLSPFTVMPIQMFNWTSRPEAAFQVNALIGPSGCGKSTFLRCFNRMHDLYPGNRYQGRIVLQPDNSDLLAPEVDPIEVRMRIGMVFQKPNPFPKSIFDNVAYGLRVRGENSRRRIEAEVRCALQYV